MSASGSRSGARWARLVLSVVVGTRNPGQAAAAVADIEGVEVGQLDLLDPQSIEAFAARYRDSGRPLHILVNGAGMPRAGPQPATHAAMRSPVRHQPISAISSSPWAASRPARRTQGARVVDGFVLGRHHRFADIQWEDHTFHEGQ